MAIQLSEEISPCEKFNCGFYYRCGVDKLACEAFVYFIQYGRAVPPTTMWECKGERHISYQNPDMKPTTLLFNKVFYEPEVTISKEKRGRKPVNENEVSRDDVFTFIKHHTNCNIHDIAKHFKCKMQIAANHIHKLVHVEQIVKRNGRYRKYTFEVEL